MSITLHSPFANHALLMFESGLREQQRELALAIDRVQKGMRALADSGPGDVVDDASDNASREAMFASYRQNRLQLREVELALKRIPRAILASVLPVGVPSASNGYKQCHGQPIASNARSKPSREESIE